MAVINDILDFSKIEAGKLELEVIDLELESTLDDFTKAMAHRVSEAGLEFLCNLAPEVPLQLRGDPGLPAPSGHLRGRSNSQ